MKRTMFWTIATAALVLAGCPAEEKAPEEKPAEPAEKKAPEEAAPEQPDLMPEGVEHLENPEWKDMPAPTDMPELDTSAAEGKWKTVLEGYEKALASACETSPEKVIVVDAENSRVGYTSYKNKMAPVPGYFPGVRGFGVTGEKPETHLVVNPLSLDSGDPVRDRKLKKLFFQLADPKNAVFVFRGSKIDGTLPEKEGGSAKATVHGTLQLHGKSQELALPFEVKKTAGGWEASLAQETWLLGFEPFGLADPLMALMKSCNHQHMGTSADLDLTLKLVPGCN